MSVERDYHIGTTGRVKSAGVPMDSVFELTAGFRQFPTESDAQQTTEGFFRLRQAPPDEVRDRFFPRNRGNKAMFRNGSLLLRPILKTDQGGGQFLPFTVGETESENMCYTIAHEEGYCVPEAFFERQLREKKYPLKVMGALDEVKKRFGELDIQEAQLAYERLQVVCEEAGITHQHDAQIGREALFFIRPSASHEEIVIPRTAYRSIYRAIQQQIECFSETTQEARRQFARKYDIPVTSGPPRPPIYFQADVQLFPDGKALVDQVQLPDVGLFLTSFDVGGCRSLKEVQQKVEPLLGEVIDSVVSVANANKRSQLFLVTRPEVLENDEDLLEIRELQVFVSELEKRGIEAQTITVAQARDLESEDTALFFNVDTDTSAFQELCRRDLSGDGATFYPDPFLLLKRQELTNYPRIRLTTDHVGALRSIVREVEIKGNGSAEKQFRQLLALDNYLNRLGLSGDVFHLYISSQKTPVACFRYDARGFQIGLNYIKPGDAVEIRSVPIDPSRAVLFNASGRPLYSVFRFMVIRSDR